jgi:hypothetical protein
MMFEGIEDFEVSTGYSTVDSDHGIQAIKLTDEPYSGIIFSYGKVEFPDSEEPILSFEYNLHHVPDGMIYDEEEFKQYIGDFLIELIMWGLKQNSIVYKGGVDE